MIHLEPPGPPREVQGISSGPRSFIIMWEEPMITNGGITGYIVLFGRLVDGLTTNMSRESNDRTITVNGGITANTTYVIVVYAINEHGIGIQSEQAFVTTDTFSSEFSILSIYKYMCSSHPPLPLPLPPPPPLPHLPSSPPPLPF